MGIDILKEIHDNFVNYAYEVNSQRAFPSVVDGLKPGQRACLWEFYTKGFPTSCNFMDNESILSSRSIYK